MKTAKKFFSVAAAALCSVTLFAWGQHLNADAEEGTYGDLTYITVDEDGNGTDDYIEISDCDKSVTAVDIPAEINELPVKVIGYYAFSNCTYLTNIIIPDSVTSIITHAFSYCSKLTNIVIPDGVTFIGENAFSNCSNLEKITIPNSITSIEKNAFADTKLLDSQTGIKYADTWVIDCDKDVTSVEIKEGTRGIADEAFYFPYEEIYLDSPRCYIKNVTIPDGVVSIGKNAFKESSQLEDITIPESVISIGDNAFDGCSSLTKIIIPNSVISIGAGTFSYCLELSGITIKNPDCAIYDSKSTISDTAVIYGYENSTAQAYAEEYNRTFVVLDGQPQVTTTAVTTAVTTKSTTSATTSKKADTASSTQTTVATTAVTTSISYNYDVNDDGVVNQDDLDFLTAFFLNPGSVEIPDEEHLSLLDINGNQKIDMVDVLLLQNYLESLSKPGDMDGDGETSVSDAVMLQKCLIGFNSISDEDFSKADLNGDGKLNVFDLIILKRRIIAS